MKELFGKGVKDIANLINMTESNWDSCHCHQFDDREIYIFYRDGKFKDHFDTSLESGKWINRTLTENRDPDYIVNISVYDARSEA